MSSIFLDRQELKQELFQLLEDIQLHNTVYILSSRSGLGKSTFSQYIIDHIKDTYPAIKICIPIGNNISIDEGFYIKEIVKTISDYSTIFGYESMNEYLKNTTNTLVKKIWLHKIVKDAENINGFIKPINSMISYFDQTGEFSEQGLFNIDNSQYTYTIFNEYLIHICCNIPKLIINVENIQQIDKVSLMQLRELLKKTNNLFLLLEYTSSNDSLNEAKKFEQNFSLNYTKIITKRLEKLDYKYTCELLQHIYPKYSNVLDESRLKEIYITIDGNMRQLSDIEYVYNLSDDHSFVNTSENFTTQRLRSLSNAHQIQLLCLVYTHRSQVSNEILKALINQKAYTLFIKYNEVLFELMGENGLLEFNYSENSIRLQHDSIGAAMKKLIKFEPKIALSYSWWIDYYEKELESSNIYDSEKIKDIVKNLCYFYLHYEPAAVRILDLLPYIRIMLLNSINPDEAISFLIQFYDMFKNMKNKECLYQLELFLLRIYYETGIFDKAFSIYKNIEFRSYKSKILYNIMLMERLQREDEAITIINNELKATEDKHYELILLLVKMIASASLNKYDDCLSIFNFIENNKTKYEQFYEYGFFLRNSEIVLNLKDAIPYLEKSVVHFQNYKQKLYEAHARISLVMNFSRLGNFDEARKHLVEAKKILKNESLERHILLNNEVALEMCEGNFDIKLEDNLKLAMCTATTIFDKIVINHNLLILCKKNNQYNEGNQIVEYLLELLEIETNKLNICFSYWDISYFYKNYDDIQYNYFYNKYINMYEDLIQKPMRKSVLEKNVFHKPNMEFVIEFISYWHFPIPDEL